MDNKEIVYEMIRDFYPFAKKSLGFNKPVRIFLTNDIKNASDPLGKTAYYDPQNMQIKLFFVNRHPKDVVRSLAHELMHHKQNCDGRLSFDIGEYATENKNLMELEEEAQKSGILVRKWEELCKKSGKKFLNAYLSYDQAKEEGELMETKRENSSLNIFKKSAIKNATLQESKVTKNSDMERSLDDTTESDTVKDHYAKRAARVFDKLTEKMKKKKEKEGGDK